MKPIVAGLIFLAALGIAAVPAAAAIRTIVENGHPAAAGPVDPRTDPCAREGGTCDPAAAAARVAANLEAQPPTGIVLDRVVAEAKARALAVSPLSPGAPASATVYSALLTRSEYEKIAKEGRNYAVNADRKVWVVTVHAPIATSGSPTQPSAIVEVYSVALDGETGQWTDYCIGCAWLNASR